ncbi:MAG TPA: alpha/beta hydrolase fold domain-containing protein [Microbacterium sp.]|nr:alpha/beta hydrolase fold domain-containing protein [Microbacterium sp.]
MAREARRRSRAPLWRGAAAAAPDLVLDADRDSLRVSGEAFARELAAAGVVMRYVVVPDTSHGFLDRPAEPIGGQLRMQHLRDRGSLRARRARRPSSRRLPPR